MIQVNEIFGPTVQGEGRSAGRPCAFLRLANCNLHCIWCDTPHTWNWTGTPFAHPDKYDREQEVHKMTVEQVVARLDEIRMKTLIVSGGEPFMQQKQLPELFRVLRPQGYWIEVETNGTLVPRQEFMDLVDQVNCSPKLSNNGADPLKLRRNPKALAALAASPKVNFKFVVCDDNDMEEILDIVNEFKPQEVRLMPECRTREELIAKEPWLQGICAQHGFIYTTRLSILRSGTKRGV